MKRSASSEPSSAESTPTKKSNTGSPPSVKGKADKRVHLGEWTGRKKADLIAKLLARGLENTSRRELAAELDLSEAQITEATKKGKNNVRTKVIAYAESL